MRDNRMRKNNSGRRSKRGSRKTKSTAMASRSRPKTSFSRRTNPDTPFPADLPQQKFPGERELDDEDRNPEVV